MDPLFQSPRRIATTIAVGALAVAGVVGLWLALGWLAPLALVAVAAVAALPLSLPSLDLDNVLRLVGAVAVATLALVGFNVLLAQIACLQLPILLGLGAAVLLFGFVAYWYLQRAEWGFWRTVAAAAALAILAIVLPPLVLGLREGDSEEVPRPEPVASKLDVLIVTDGGTHPKPQEVPPDPALAEFDIRFAVGYAKGETIRWTLTGGESAGEALRVASMGARAKPATGTGLGPDGVPAVRPGSDPVMLLLVDGTAPVTMAPGELPQRPARRGEIGRWRRIAFGALPPGTPAFALLQTTRKQRLARWERLAAPLGTVSAQALESLTATDAAVRLAISSPTSRADLTLAMAHRPVLLFDSEEPVPRPLSVEALFAGGRVRLCHRGQLKTDCDPEPILHPAELENGGTHLQLDTPSSAELRATALGEQAAAEAEATLTGERTARGAPPEGTPPAGATLLESASTGSVFGGSSAIYVHPVSVERNGKRLLYLDYWWFLPDNPVDVGGGAWCGAGLVIPGVTCHDHRSDWEGITVVVDRTEEPVVTAVHYAQHSHVVRYDWNQLRQHWDTDPRLAPFVATVADASARPLAFVAKGTHATYPIPCASGCKQVADPDIGEGRYDGDLPWAGNDTGACGRSSCLRLLPTREGGLRPALWNAFDGPWGERNCALTYYCDSGSAPPAPGRQARYRDPAHYDAAARAELRFRVEQPRGG